MSPALSGSVKAYQYARLGACRLGATRLDYYVPIVLVTVAGTVRTTKFRKYDSEIVDSLNEAPDTASLQFQGQGWTPLVGQEVILGIGSLSNRLFRGQITKLTQLQNRTGTRLHYQAECIDWSFLLDRRLVTKKWPSSTADVIVKDLIATFTSGFTTVGVQGGLSTIGEFECKMETVSAALTRLAQLDGSVWLLNEKDLVFRRSLSTQAPATLSVTNKTFKRLTYAKDLSQVRTRVIVEGMGTTTAAGVAVGAVSLPVAETQPFSAAGSVICPGGQIVTYTGRSVASGAGNLTGVPASGTGSVVVALNSGDTVNLLVTRNDVAAQAAVAALEGGDGIHEYYLQDRRLSIAGCEARGDTELALGKSVLETIGFVSEDKFCRSGATATVNLPASGLTGLTAKIQSVRIGWIKGRRWPQREVTASSQLRTFYDLLRELDDLARKRA
jgi:hypothetical protein